MRHVLIADDEQRIRDVVQYALEREGYRVSIAEDGEQALSALARPDPIDLVVLDVMMPHVDGLEVCRRLRQTARTPVLFLSAKAEEIDRILGLELGGDDYLSKPFSPRELVARVKAILRRYEQPSEPEQPDSAITYGPIRIDRARHEVTCEGNAIKMTATEFGALSALFERPGVVLSRTQLMERAYAYDNHVTERTIDTHIRRIRAKFRPHGVDPIATVHGVGYKAASFS